MRSEGYCGILKKVMCEREMNERLKLYLDIAEPLLVLYKLSLKNASVPQRVANMSPVFEKTLGKMWKIPDW